MVVGYGIKSMGATDSRHRNPRRVNVISNELCDNLHKKGDLDDNKCFAALKSASVESTQTGNYSFSLMPFNESPVNEKDLVLELNCMDKKGKPQRNKNLSITLNSKTFCGLEKGTYTGCEGNTNRYLALICDDKTVLFRTNEEDNLSKLRRLAERKLEFVECWTLSCMEPFESRYLLLLSKSHISIATIKWHLVMHKWNLIDCIPSLETQENGLLILSLSLVSPKGVQQWKFETRRAEHICQLIRTAKISIRPPMPVPRSIPSSRARPIRVMSRQQSEDSRTLSHKVEQIYEDYMSDPSRRTTVEELYMYGACRNNSSQRALTPSTTPSDRESHLDLNELARHGSSKAVLKQSMVRAVEELKGSNWNYNAPSLPRSCGNQASAASANCETSTGAANDMADTIATILKNPLGGYGRDTLELTQGELTMIGLRLYNTTPNVIADWSWLAEQIGLTYEAITLVKALVLNQAITRTAAEIVLIHWQYMYNRFYGTTDYTCEQPCTREGLKNLLRDIERFDILYDVFKESPE